MQFPERRVEQVAPYIRAFYSATSELSCLSYCFQEPERCIAIAKICTSFEKLISNIMDQNTRSEPINPGVSHSNMYTHIPTPGNTAKHVDFTVI